MSEIGGDDAVAAAARAAMVTVRRGEHALLEQVLALDTAGVVAKSGYRALRRLLEDLWRLDPARARRLVTRAALLEPRTTMTGEQLQPVLPATAAASAAGLLDDGHLRVVADAADHLARVPDLSPENFADAEATLAHHATHLAPAGLEKIARRLIAHLDPDGAAPPDPAEPLDEFRMIRHHDGTLSMAGEVVGRAEAELVVEVFDRLSAPAGPDDTRTLAQRRAEVLLDLCAQAASPTGIAASPGEPEAAETAEAEACGGEDGAPGGDETAGFRRRDRCTGDGAEGRPGQRGRRARRECRCPTVPVLGRALLAVTMTLDDLRADTGHAVLDSGHAITPAAVRRMACDAGVVPMVLGSRGEPLDVGRLSYSVTDAQRRALIVRDRGCSWPGCTRRPARCHAHHVLSWLELGDTTIENLTLLCRFHHHVVHHGGWVITMRNGRPWYTPPAWIDPSRTPRPGGPETAVAG